MRLWMITARVMIVQGLTALLLVASHSPISDAVNTTTSWSDTTTFYVIGVDTTDNNGQNTTLPDTDLPDNTVTDVTVTYGNITLENSTAVSTAGFTTKEPPKISSNIFTSENIATTYLVIGNIGMVTNAFVIIVMSFTPSMWKTFINIYIMNQSVTDFLVSLFLSASYNLNSDVPYPGIRGDIYCKLWLSRTFMWAFLNVSTYNLVLLSMERYAEVLHPFWHKSHVTRKGILISVLVIWVTGTVFELAGKLPPTYVSDGVCVFMRRWPNQAARKAYGFMVVIIKFVVPLVILICAYGRIAWELHKKIEQSTSGKDARLQRGKRNTIKTMAIVSAAFVLCWVWNQVNFLLFNAGFGINLYSDFSHFTIMAIYVNCCLNPFIYALTYEQFQKATKKLFCKMIGRKPSNRVDDTSGIDTSSTTQD